VAPGDLIAMGDSDSTLTTAGAGTWLAAAIATGTILRTVLREVNRYYRYWTNIIAALAGGFNIILCNLIQQNHGQPLRYG